MNHLVSIFGLLAGVGGVILLVLGHRAFRKTTLNAEPVPALGIMRIAVHYGLGSACVFLGLILLGSWYDEQYNWSLQKLGGAILIALIPGVIAMLGSAYQVYTTLIFRGILIKRYKAKGKHQGDKD